MFKVECPGCKAPYQVDERRIPPSGLKMRCPKCGTSFKVDPSSDPLRTGPSPVLGGAFGLGADSIPPPALAPPKPHGAPPPVQPREPAAKATMLGIAPAAPPSRAPAAPPGPASNFGEIDLPAPIDPASDLPSPARSAPRPMQAPPPRPAPPRAPAGSDADLPARRGSSDLPAVSAPRAAPLELDLPSITSIPPAAPLPRASSSARPAGGFGEIELDLATGIDLPSPRASSGRPGGALDLPSPTGAGLPSVQGSARSRADLPSPARSDLPSVGGTGLPSPTQPGLPSLGGASLPSLGGASLPSLGGAGLPTHGTPGLPAPFPGARAPSLPNQPAISPAEWDLAPGAAPARPRMESFGELELPLVNPPGPSRPPAPGLDLDPFGEEPLPPPRASTPAPMAAVGSDVTMGRSEAPQGIVRQAGGGTAYGEVDLGGDDVEAAPAPPAPPAPPARGGGEEDMEFGEVPQGAEAPRPAEPVHVPAPAAPASPQVSLPAAPTRRRAPRVFALVFILLVAGAALALVPSLGPFGAYWVIDRVRASEYERLVAATAATARKRLGSDTAPDAAAAIAAVDAARTGAKRVHALTAYAAFVRSVRELRFGSEPELHARTKVLLDELEDKADAAHLTLARAARAASDGQLARARQSLAAIVRSTPKNVDALVVTGEVELRARDAKAALAAWTSLSQLENSARAAFGLARAYLAAADINGAEREAKRALERNPEHVGARILLARIAASTREREAEAVSSLEDIAKQPVKASSDELASVHTLLGDIHLTRSRISRAEAAYTEALRIQPKAASALTGLGDALYRAGRYSEAQARFEAGVQADPDNLFAKVGVAKTKLSLERLEDASASLKKLRESHPSSPLVAYWQGRALEAQGNRSQAEKAYREAIDGAENRDPVLVDAYIGLALLLDQGGRAEDAQKTLQAARERLPSSAAIHRALGEWATGQGRYAEAQAELRRAIELDPEDLGAPFRLGVALRRDGKADEAEKIFDQVGATDRDYPGLALERGLLQEAQGRTEEALRSYEAALSKARDDPDLMLRVGCGYATAHRTKEAQELLRKVLALRPTSAETNHCLGKALLFEGSRLADSLRVLDRAVELDPNRAVFHLYVGWAANEAGNVPKAERALNEAIRLDNALADAYWQRGVLRARQGAVRDAVLDLRRALELSPTRYEAHAALADAYYDLGKEGEALAEWRKAVEAKPDNAQWRFRYGKLLLANHNTEAARSELGRALALAEKSGAGERWLWEAHHLMARAVGMRPDAVPHWEAFLRLGPLDSPYRGEAKAALEKLGKPWAGN